MLWEIKTHLALISCASKQEEKKINNWSSVSVRERYYLDSSYLPLRFKHFYPASQCPSANERFQKRKFFIADMTFVWNTTKLLHVS